MGNADEQHFDSYRAQTRVKHAILEGYLPSYYNIIKRWQKNLLFIDGFAGRGTYSSGDGEFEGSPIRALRVISSNKDLAKQVLCVFFERDEGYFKSLEQRVAAFTGDHVIEKEPIMRLGKFSEQVDELLKGVDPDKGLAPTFLFVDPCGCDDVTMNHIADILSRDYCEVFIFFNYEGINRITGLAEKRDIASGTLTKLYGSDAAAEAMVTAIREAKSTHEREQVIVTHYKNALASASGAEFFLPLRIEKEGRKSTSHYLLHATKHPLGFRIMKEVMWAASGGLECEGDHLALLQASETGGGRLFDPAIEELREAVLGDLANGPERVNKYRVEWVERPEDMFCESVYRRQILNLEADGKIEILAADGITPMPASKRPKRKGPTLSKDKNFVAQLAKRYDSPAMES